MDYSNNRHYKIGAIVVLYNPKLQTLSECINSLTSQVDKICVVDNSSIDNTKLFAEYGPKIEYKPLMSNTGIAHAQNIGIKYFVNLNYDFILFCDQDSVSPNNIINNLVNSYISLCSDNNNIAAVGPMPVNKKFGRKYIHKEDILSTFSYNNTTYYKMRSLISSYTLVPAINFNIIGMMNERLFIDYVDLEWCWRAETNNMTFIMVPTIEIDHELGQATKFLGHNISLSTPTRTYYQTRNLLWMLQVKYAPSYWKKKNIIKLIPRITYYVFMSQRRIAYIKNFIKGLYHGITQSLIEKNNIK